MSDTPLPVYVDARKAFVNETSLQGTVEVNKLPRIAACTTDQQGQIWTNLTFSIDRAGRRRIKGVAQSRLMLTCQRCLEPVATDLAEEIDLVLVDDEEGARQLDKEYEPWIAEDNRIVLAALLDEQLLLGMPIVSFHETGPCIEKSRYQSAEQGTDQQDQEPQGSKPFAVLADFKVERE